MFTNPKIKNARTFFLMFQLLPFFMNGQTHYISNKIDLKKFETIKNFILEKGDILGSYRNFDNDNPHYSLDNYELYLGSDVGQKNINNDPKLSDFNELAVRIKQKDSFDFYLRFIAVRKGDVALNKQWLTKTMKEGNVYVEKIRYISAKETENYIEKFIKALNHEIKK